MSEFDRLAGELEANLEPFLLALLERVGASVPAWMVENAFLWEEIHDFARASLGTQLAGFRRGVLPDSCPEVDAAGAQSAAKVGELKALLNGYRMVQMSLWEAWLDLIESSVTDSAQRPELLKRGSEYFFRYAGLLSDYVADIYQLELERVLRSGEQRRFDAIRGLLEGERPLDADLDFDLEQHHLGFVAWGEESDAGAREMAAVLDRQVLVVPVLNQSWWGWLSGPRPLASGQERQLGRLQSSPQARIAFGLEAHGVAGFCATNRQALRARRVARRTERPVVFYADVAVEALASDNQEDARSFVAHELRGIEDDSPASQRIRETLAAYFAAEHNAASAAASLGVHQQTIANRLRVAEERLGHPVGARRVELEVALRLRESMNRADS